MAPVLASTSSLGVRPWLAGAVAPAAAAFRAPVADTAGRPPGSDRTLRVRTPLTWSGVRLGWRSSSSAATLETIGAAIEVPPARMYWPETTQVGHSAVKALAGARLETMRAGALISAWRWRPG